MKGKALLYLSPSYASKGTQNFLKVTLTALLVAMQTRVRTRRGARRGSVGIAINDAGQVRLPGPTQLAASLPFNPLSRGSVPSPPRSREPP